MSCAAPPWRGVVTIADDLLRGLPVALLVATDGGEIALANRRAGEILGRNPEEIEGARLGALLPGLEPSRAGGAPIRVPEGRRETAYQHPDGRSLVLGLQLSPLGRRGAPPMTVIAFQDVSSHTALRRERDRLLQLAAVGDVLPAILHELKNPLAAVTAAVEVLEEEVPEGPVRSELHAILGEVRRMKLAFEGVGLLNQDVRSARLQAIDVAAAEVCRVLAAQLASKGVEGRCDAPPLPLLPFDTGVVRAILFNLITNALHACRRGDSITVEARLVAEGSALRLVVRDTGSGMPPDVLARCRELFFTTKPNGSGIGLALCESTVHSAGGSLEIASTEGTGTEVVIDLPLPSSGAPPAPPGGAKR